MRQPQPYSKPSYEFRVLLEAQRKRLLATARENSFAVETEPLDAIELALGRIREGSYGICMQCEGQIERARLKADPTTDYCAACDDQA